MPIVQVRALQRGYYDETPGREIIRNEGEVFNMDTAHMKRPGALGEADATVISAGPKNRQEDYLLPFWVELAKDSAATITADDEIPRGHTTKFDKANVI